MLDRIKNNLIHLFFEFENPNLLIQLGVEFLSLFEAPLNNLNNNHGIQAITLEFSELLNKFHAQYPAKKMSRDEILGRLNALFKDLSNYWELGIQLKDKYIQAGVLQAAIYAKIFMARELFRLLRKTGGFTLNSQIRNLTYNYDELANQISHHITDEDHIEHKELKQEGRELFHYEEFPAFRLLEYAKINPQVFSLLAPSQTALSFLTLSAAPQPSPGDLARREHNSSVTFGKM